MTQAENRNTTNQSGRAVVAGLSNRRGFIGGSDARIIMGQDEKALISLWQEKRSEVGSAPTYGSAGMHMTVGRRPAAPYLLPGFFGVRLRSLTPGPSPISRWVRFVQIDRAILRPWPLQQALRVRQPHPAHRTHFRSLFSRSLTPGPPPLASMNSTPVASKALLITSSVARRGSWARASNWRTVTMPTAAFSASSC
jgi:hypothetical protein